MIFQFHKMRLERIRQLKSLETLAAETGEAVSTLQRAENGVGSPRLLLVAAVAAALNVDLREWLA